VREKNMHETHAAVAKKRFVTAAAGVGYSQGAQHNVGSRGTSVCKTFRWVALEGVGGRWRGW